MKNLDILHQEYNSYRPLRKGKRGKDTSKDYRDIHNIGLVILAENEKIKIKIKIK